MSDVLTLTIPEDTRPENNRSGRMVIVATSASGRRSPSFVVVRLDSLYTPPTPSGRSLLGAVRLHPSEALDLARAIIQAAGVASAHRQEHGFSDSPPSRESTP